MLELQTIPDLHIVGVIKRYFMDDLQLTSEQLKAAKKVYKAMKIAGKLGVYFWDNYGTLQCYNAKKISLPVPDDTNEISIRDCDPTYYEMLKNYSTGNADDELFYNVL